MYATKDTTVWNVPYEGGTGVTTLNKDDEVKVTAQCNETGWYKVTVNKKTGYVSEDSLTTVKPEPPVPTEAPKEEDEIKLSFHGVFDTITIKDYSLFKKEIRIT